MESRKQTGTRRQRASAENDELSLAEIFGGALFGLAAMVISALVLLLIGTGIAYSNKDPAALTKPLALASLYISIFAGGFFSAKRSKGNRLLCGVLFTALVFVLIFLLRLIMRGNGEGISGSAYYLLGALASSVLGVLSSSFSRGKKPLSKKKRAEKFSRKK